MSKLLWLLRWTPILTAVRLDSFLVIQLRLLLDNFRLGFIPTLRQACDAEELKLRLLQAHEVNVKLGVMKSKKSDKDG